MEKIGQKIYIFQESKRKCIRSKVFCFILVFLPTGPAQQHNIEEGFPAFFHIHFLLNWTVQAIAEEWLKDMQIEVRT